MISMDSVVFVLEMVGVVASAISGAITAIRREMDAFGVVILGLTTAVGGGMVRDILLGQTPPMVFIRPIYAIVAMSVSLITFIAVYLHKLHYNTKLYDRALLIMDTLGLAAYTVSGMGVAYSRPEEYSTYLIVFVGVITGVGGGVLRDLFAGNRPYIFVKHIYALASIAGAIACALLRGVIGQELAMLAGMVVIIIIRITSAALKLNLPKIKAEEAEK